MCANLCNFALTLRLSFSLVPSPYVMLGGFRHLPMILQTRILVEIVEFSMSYRHPILRKVPQLGQLSVELLPLVTVLQERLTYFILLFHVRLCIDGIWILQPAIHILHLLNTNNSLLTCTSAKSFSLLWFRGNRLPQHRLCVPRDSRKSGWRP